MMYYNSFGPLHAMFSVLGWVLIAWLISYVFWGGCRRRRWMDYHDMHKGDMPGNMGSQMGHGPHHNKALDLLNERYVKGEITKEEFDSKKKDILS